MGSEEPNNIKIVPNSVIFKLRGNDKLYQEAMEASAKFNKRLINERKMRIPFIDSQTRVAQANSTIWNGEYQREKTDRDGYIYTYPVKKWYKNRRLLFENDSAMLAKIQMPIIDHQQMYSANENSNHMDSNSNGSLMINSQQQHSILKQTSNSNDDYDHYKISSTALNSMGDEWHMMHEESFENFETVNKDDNDNDSDADDYEDSKRKKAKRGKAKKKPEPNHDDKPFVCDKCGVKYKTKPGLSYHIQKAHNPNTTPAPNTANSSSIVSSKTTDIINPDENPNSVFESVYDDMNSSSSLPHVSSTSHLNQSNSNHNTNFSLTVSASNQQQQQIGNHSNSHASSSSHNLHQQQKNSSSSSSSSNKCGVCYGTEQEAKSVNQSEQLVSCCECNKSFHPTCLNFSANMILSVKKYNWQCIECKRCTICGNMENDDKLLFCDDCDRGYHMYCLNPPLTEAPAGDWRCELCIKQFGPQ